MEKSSLERVSLGEGLSSQGRHVLRWHEADAPEHVNSDTVAAAAPCRLLFSFYLSFSHSSCFFPVAFSSLIYRLSLLRKSGTSDPLSLTDPVIFGCIFMFFRFKSI